MGKKKQAVDLTYESVIDGVKKIYASKIKPVEVKYKFDYLMSPLLKDADFEARPMVLFLGQYSTGKTTFINYLLNADYPGAHIGPEPTTDRFMAIMHGPTNSVIPGNTLAVQADKPFTALSKFGNDFLNKFNGAYCNLPILEHLTFVDTPGVLSGEKQRIGRSYDFTEVVQWFAERADMIILVFDAHKLDISDEFKYTIEALKKNEDKIRIVLNKSDMVPAQNLMRVYGALMWSLGKVLHTPECLRVYVSSYWDKPFKPGIFVELFEDERTDLLNDLHALPKLATVRKVNELVKRARSAKVNAYIISTLKERLPMFGKEKAIKQMLEGMNTIFNEVMRKYNLSSGDFPNITQYKERLQNLDWTKFEKLDLKLITAMDEVLANDIPVLLKKFPMEDEIVKETNPFELQNNFERCCVALNLTEEFIENGAKIYDKLPKNKLDRVSGKIVCNH